MKFWLNILCAALLWFSSAVVDAQGVSRGQVMKTMYQVNMALENGQDAVAIAKLDDLAKLLPRMPLIYLRQAEIYEGMAERGDASALPLAVEKYRKYLTVEMDTRKAASVGQKLRALEDRLQTPHFEEVEAEKAREEVATQKVLPVVVDDAAALLFAQEAIMLPDPLPTISSPSMLAVADVPVVDTAVDKAEPQPQVSGVDSVALYTQTKAEAEQDSCKLYQLAIYMYYGIGTKADSVGAIRLMNQCAMMPCGKEAALWLATFYFEKAYEDNGLSTISKRTYMEASRYNMALLKMKNAPEWYLLKSKMLETGDLSDIEAAAGYRQKAAELGITQLPSLKPDLIQK